MTAPLIALGLPAYLPYDPRVCVSLIDFAIACERRGTAIHRICVMQDPDISHCHNVIFSEFLKGKADRLLIVDSDIVFSPNDAFRLLDSELDFVGGNYRRKCSDGSMASRVLDGGEVRGEMVEAEFLATGFSCISRNALSKVGGSTHAGFDGDRWLASDEWLSLHWRAFGQCWLDSGIKLGHVGTIEYR